MTNDKARDFFSAYQEGTLEPGLRASLERRLDSDEGLRSEYVAFTQTIASLYSLRNEAIVVPGYLSDRIALRLEPAIQSKAVPFWKALFAPKAATPRYGWAMAAAGAFLIAAIGLRGLGSGDVAQAGIVGGGGESVRWTQGTDGFVAFFGGSGERKVGVLPEGGTIQEYRLLSSQPFELGLSNPNAGARRFKLTVGEDDLATVALPGIRPFARKAGTGTVTELASALADAYRVPVVVKGLPMTTRVRWSFENADARTAAEESLEGHGSATMMDGNVLQIGR